MSTKTKNTNAQAPTVAQAAPQAPTVAQAAPQAPTVAQVQAPTANPLAAIVAATLAAHATAAAAAKPKIAIVHASTLAHPVAAVHALCAAILEAAPLTGRNVLIAQCVESGIATATARTQVQVYLGKRKAATAEATKV